MEKILDNGLLYDEMEKAEELGDGEAWVGIGIGVAVFIYVVVT